MMVAVKALTQLVFYAFVIAVAFALMSKVIYGADPVRVILSGGDEVAGEIIDVNDPKWIWFRSHGNVTTVLRPIPRERITRIVPVIPEKLPLITVDDVLRHYRVPTVAELIRKAFLGELTPVDLGT